MRLSMCIFNSMSNTTKETLASVTIINAISRRHGARFPRFNLSTNTVTVDFPRYSVDCGWMSDFCQEVYGMLGILPDEGSTVTIDLNDER